MPVIRRAHARTIAVPAHRVGALLDRLAGPDDPLWPSPAWPAMRLDRPLSPGAAGGHGPVRYTVTTHVPGRRVRFRFTALWEGWHELAVEPLDAGRCRLWHRMAIRPRGRTRLAWTLGFRPLHDAVIRQLMDNAQREATGQAPRPARWSPWVRLLHRALWPRPTPVTTPPGARLARAAFERIDLAAAWQVSLYPRLPRDPERWRAVFRRSPAVVTALLLARQPLVPRVAARPRTGDAFAPVARTDDEVLLGADAAPLAFRVSLHRADDLLTLTTVARAHNRRGRLYLSVVRRLHPLVVRPVLRHAHRRLALRATPGAAVRS